MWAIGRYREIQGAGLGDREESGGAWEIQGGIGRYMEIHGGGLGDREESEGAWEIQGDII